GEISFFWHRISCRQCGRTIVLLKEFLKLGRYQGKTHELERIVVNAVAETSYRRAVKGISEHGLLNLSHHTAHNWVIRTDCDEIALSNRVVGSMGPTQIVADGTKFKAQAVDGEARRGDLKVAIGVNREGEVFPLGSWTGESWENINAEWKKNELKFRLKHSGSRFVFVTKQHAQKIEDIRHDLPDLEKVIFIDRKDNPGENDIEYLDLFSLGDEFRKTNQEDVDSIWKNIQPNDLANISYTSGTTADPKGIMLSHLNYAANVVQSNTLMELHPDWKTLAILPWDHAFAHTTCLYAFMYKGASIASVEEGNTPFETLRNIPKNIKEIQPSLMMSVPAFSKVFRKNIESQIQKKGETLYKVFQFALKVAYAYNGYGFNKGKGCRMLLKPMMMLFNQILFKKIREGFGGKLQFFIGGGALLDTELQRFFYAVGIPICQGYGLTEASPVISSNALNAIKFGSSGKLVKYMDLKIMDEDGNEMPVGQKGEIVIKGDNVMA
ncbi:MAG: hypothetical protein EOM73_14195, partial [Bacteroidia bacterium]|nr:hypothetical protein [Bacteroidia bacterium]